MLLQPLKFVERAKSNCEDWLFVAKFYIRRVYSKSVYWTKLLYLEIEFHTSMRLMYFSSVSEGFEGGLELVTGQRKRLGAVSGHLLDHGKRIVDFCHEIIAKHWKLSFTQKSAC